ncbi:MAG: sulfotransferase domain-containing protein [Candidatus Omnitrophica bacterium]|nr:sulfotransferase domain-containing protein [Candidatus Omnitrophota bacterium]
MFFVLSSGRSGSKTITYALDGYNNCECYHHPNPGLTVEATQYYYGEYPEEKIAELLCTTRSGDSRDKIYGEVNLQLSLLIPVLEKVFPGCKYIWLLRDGRDVIASMFYRQWYNPDDIKVPDEWKKGRLQGDRTGDFSPAEWGAMSRFDKCCWLWKKYNLIIESQMQKLDKERWMRVKLDQLKAMMPEIAQFLGLKDDRKVLVERHNRAYQPVVYWEDWDADMRNSFEAICGELMERWFPAWRDKDGTWQKIKPEVPDKVGFVLRLKRFLLDMPLKIRYKAGDIKKIILKKFKAPN